jgi:hypothetical protein
MITGLSYGLHLTLGHSWKNEIGIKIDIGSPKKHYNAIPGRLKGGRVAGIYL